MRCLQIEQAKWRTVFLVMKPKQKEMTFRWGPRGRRWN